MTLRVHGPLVLGEGEEKKLTTRLNEFELSLVAFRPCDKYDGDIEVDLARSLQHPPSPVITAQVLKSHRGCAYTVPKVYPIIDVGQTGQKGKGGDAQRHGSVHKCVADGCSP